MFIYLERIFSYTFYFIYLEYLIKFVLYILFSSGCYYIISNSSAGQSLWIFDSFQTTFHLLHEHFWRKHKSRRKEQKSRWLHHLCLQRALQHAICKKGESCHAKLGWMIWGGTECWSLIDNDVDWYLIFYFYKRRTMEVTGCWQNYENQAFY